MMNSFLKRPVSLNSALNEILLGHLSDDRVHDLVDAFSRLEHRQLLADVDGVLAGEIRPFGIVTVAVDAVTCRAHRGLGCAGVCGALYGFLGTGRRSEG